MTTPDDAGAAADQAHSPAMVRADLLTAIVFIVLAAAMLYGSWTMDRLEVRRIHPFTAPGVVPGLLSAALLLCGIVLAIRSLRLPAPGGWTWLAEPRRRLAQSLPWALGLAIATAAIVTLVFERAFLVRLP